MSTDASEKEAVVDVMQVNVVEELERQIRNLKSQHEKMRDVLGSARGQRDEAEKKVEDLRFDLRAQRERSHTLQQEVDFLKAHIDQGSEKFDKLRREYDNLEMRCGEMDMAIERYAVSARVVVDLDNQILSESKPAQPGDPQTVGDDASGPTQ